MKRAFDCLASLLALAALSPLILLVAGLVRIKLGSPVFFAQLRPGLKGRPFRIWKFRTMTDGRDGSGNLLPDSDRLTGFGRWLRASSLDELPELWNVLRGDMSLVGPRPLLTQYLERYSPEEARRHEVRPGLTGWAQINGRNATTWEERLRLDVWYVDHGNFLFDLRILCKTVTKVLRKEGINSPDVATMPEFYPPSLHSGETGAKASTRDLQSR
jgi:sugar transferase EpsL